MNVLDCSIKVFTRVIDFQLLATFLARGPQLRNSYTRYQLHKIFSKKNVVPRILLNHVMFSIWKWMENLFQVKISNFKIVAKPSRN